MDENLEAIRFSRELDSLMSGGPTGAEPGSELAADLEFAGRLCRSDLSSASAVRRPLKQKLVEKADGRWFRFLAAARPTPRLAALAACLVVAIVSPFAVELMFQEEARDSGAMSEGWSFGKKDDLMPYQGGAANSLGGGAVVTPRDPSATVAGNAYWKAPLANVTARDSGESWRDHLSLGAAASPASSAREVPGGQGRSGMGLAEKYREPVKGKLQADKGDWKEAIVRAQLQAMREPVDREGYDRVVDNDFISPKDQPLSTFSIDVDAASYANTRRILGEGRLPPPDAVRIEEFINYFRYDYPEPAGEHPFSITTELAACPWNDAHKLVRIGLKGKSIAKESMPPGNLVFLIDTSGSMSSELPLVKSALSLLVEQLRPEDHVAIVAYAGAAGLVLPSTPGSRKREILDAIDRLESGGSTAGGDGIILAYKVAAENLLKKGNNRVVLATDGDFNVGVTSDGDLTRLIEEKRGQGVFLTVLGFGSGNYQDAKMEKLADKGNGNYAYVDDIMEARKVFVHELGGTLLTIAKDVKLQIEFNPAKVGAYRLIGYENRVLAAQDFNDDKKDAGELGSGHTVTALYEIVPPGAADAPKVDPLKFQKTALTDMGSPDLLTVKFRYKDPKGETSKLIVRDLRDEERPWSAASQDFKFAASVAGFGMLLRQSEHKGSITYAKAAEMAKGALGADEGGYRSELLRLIEKAELLDRRPVPQR